jgi:hypothetical protein
LPEHPAAGAGAGQLDKPSKSDDSDILIVVQSGLAPPRFDPRAAAIADLQQCGDHPTVVPDHQADTSTAPLAQIGVDGQQVNLTALNSTTAMSAAPCAMTCRASSCAPPCAQSPKAWRRRRSTKPIRWPVWPWASLGRAEGADTRTWRTLPDKTWPACAEERRASVSLPSAVGGSLVKVTVDQRYQVISLRAVGNQVFAGGVAAHVIPSAGDQRRQPQTTLRTESLHALQTLAVAASPSWPAAAPPATAGAGQRREQGRGHGPAEHIAVGAMRVARENGFTVNVQLNNTSTATRRSTTASPGSVRKAFRSPRKKSGKPDDVRRSDQLHPASPRPRKPWTSVSNSRRLKPANPFLY